MGARRNPGSFALPVTSESAARRDFYRRGEGRGRIPGYNQPRRGVISVYPVIIVQRESREQLRQRTARSPARSPAFFFYPPCEKISILDIFFLFRRQSIDC